MSAVTIERLDLCIVITARCIADYNMPEVLPTLKRLKVTRRSMMQLVEEPV
jgi:hypothetical protein